MLELKTIGLFFITALAEILGCYLPYLWLREEKSAWLLVPAAVSLALFAWLLSLHPTAAGRRHLLALICGWRPPYGVGPGWFRDCPARHGHHHVLAEKCVTTHCASAVGAGFSTLTLSSI
jgi:Uncharacterised BCR, YnfA/UPF0060 family